MKLKLKNLITSGLNILESRYLNLYNSRLGREKILLTIITIALPGFVIIGLILTGINLMAVLMGKVPGDIAFCWGVTKYAFYGIIFLIAYVLIFGKK